MTDEELILHIKDRIARESGDPGNCGRKDFWAAVVKSVREFANHECLAATRALRAERDSNAQLYKLAMRDWRRSEATFIAMMEERGWLRYKLEEFCPNHVASDHDPKLCARCGIHIDSLRPDDEGNHHEGR